MEVPKQVQTAEIHPYGGVKTLGRIKQGLPNAIAIILMTVTSVPLLLLYVWVVVISLSGDLIGGIIPRSFTLENWSFLWSPNIELEGAIYPNAWSLFGNTFTVAVGTMIVEVTASLMAGYVLSRGNFPGSTFLLQSTLLTHAFPAITGLIASFYILNAVGLINTLTGIILLKAFAGMGMSTWIIKGFFDEVPKRLEWAASVDGSSKLQTFFQVYLPNVWPGVTAIALFSFLSGWGEYIMMSVFLFDSEHSTLSVILRGMITEDFTGSYGVVMALATFYMIPCLILYFFSQKALMKMKF